MGVRVKYNSFKGLYQFEGVGGVDFSSTNLSYAYKSEKTISVSLDYTFGDESMILVNAANANVEIFLPAAASGRTLTVKKIDATANIVTLTPISNQTIDGETDAIITVQWTSLTLQAFESAWYVK